MSRFHSLPLLINFSLPETLLGALFPPQALPLTSLVNLTVIAPLILPSLVAAVPNLENLEVVLKGNECFALLSL
jgi:hypothetical protein